MARKKTEARRKTQESRHLGSVIKSVYGGYRKVVDPMKPTIDRVVDPITLFLGANTALATTIYHGTPKAQQALEYLLTKGIGPNAYENLSLYFQNNPNLGTAGKVAAFGALYGALNYHLWPYLKEMFKGKSILPESLQKISRRLPEGFHHARTWAALGAMFAVWHFGNVGQDVKRWGGKIGDIGYKIADLVTDDELSKYLSGEKIHRVVSDISDLFDIEAYRVPVQVSKEVETELKKSEQKKPDVTYIDRVSQDAANLNSKGIKITPEQLAYISRLAYFEATFDKKAGKDPKKILEGVRGVAHVIKNRWEYENNVKDGTFAKKNRQDAIFDVAFHHGAKTRNGRTYAVWQFTCIRDNPRHFYEHRGKQGWDMYEGGKINVAVGGMDPFRAELAYQGVVDALSGKIPDPTGKSLFYQNPKFVDKYNRDWDKKLEKTIDINSHVFYKFKEGSARGPQAMDIEGPTFQNYVLSHGILESQKPMAAYARNNSLRRQISHRRAH